MATKYATSANTAWSLQVWKDAASGGNVVSAPGVGDIADLNGKAVPLDLDVTCQQIQVGAAGGYFEVTSHRVVTGDIVNVGHSSWIGYVNSGSLTITGNVYSTGSGTRYGLYNYATLTINGDVTSSNGGYMIQNVGGYGALVTITGNVVRTGSHGGDAVHHQGTASTLVVNGGIVSTSTGGGYCVRGTTTGGLATNAVTINGDVSGGLCVGHGGGVWTVNGDISSSMNGLCCDFYYGHATTINGGITALAGAGGYIVNSSAYGGTFTLNGDVRNNAATGTGYALVQYGTTVINGDVYPPLTVSDNSGTILIQPAASGALTVNGTVYGSDFGYGSTMANGFALHYSSNTARPVYPPRVKHAQSGALGMPICNGPWLMIDDTADTVRWKSPTGWRQFQDEASLESDYPDESDVRLRTIYAHGTREGTCAVPATGSVALNVAVDNTTGTAVLTQANVVTAMAAGTVAGVSGDVTGKVLGGGSGTISGVGARVVDGDGEAIVGGATAAQMWAYATRTLTQSASQVDAAVSGSTVTLVRGTSISFSLTGLGTLTGRSKLWVTGKANANDTDSAAIFQVEETAGLLRIGGAAPVSVETGTITVTDAAAGNITVTLSAAAAAKMKLVDGGVYDVKWKIGSTVLATAAAVLNVQADVTRVVS